MATSCILGAARGFHRITLGSKYILCNYTDPLGQPCPDPFTLPSRRRRPDHGKQRRRHAEPEKLVSAKSLACTDSEVQIGALDESGDGALNLE